jgi:tetratricopeptide (TPR) repeat protein
MHLPAPIRAAIFAVAVLVPSTTVMVPARAAERDADQDAALLNRWAREALAEKSVEARRRALRLITDAIKLDPEDASHWIVLGRARLLSGFDHESRDAFRRAAMLKPDSKDAFFELGMFYKREWIRTQRYGSLLRAVGAFDTATALRPGASDAWLQLVPLYYAQAEFGAAAHAAARSVAGRPRRLESRLAVAYTRHRLGAIEDADSVYQETIPLLEGELHAMYDDPAKMIGAPPNSISLADLDPDPTTPENEVVLEFWSRSSHPTRSACRCSSVPPTASVTPRSRIIRPTSSPGTTRSWGCASCSRTARFSERSPAR